MSCAWLLALRAIDSMACDSSASSSIPPARRRAQPRIEVRGVRSSWRRWRGTRP